MLTKFNATDPVRPQIIVQNPGRVLVGDGDHGQLARTFLREINSLTELATLAFATFHAPLHLQQSALHTSPERATLPF